MDLAAWPPLFLKVRLPNSVFARGLKQIEGTTRAQEEPQQQQRPGQAWDCSTLPMVQGSETGQDGLLPGPGVLIFDLLGGLNIIPFFQLKQNPPKKITAT